MCDVPPMSPRTCVVCREPLPSWARVDKTTCGPACRSRLSRARKASCNTFVTPLRAVAPRLGVAEGREPIGGQIAPLGASDGVGPASMLAITGEWKVDANPRPTNPVILALVVALRDVEARRARGKVLTDPTAKEQTP